MPEPRKYEDGSPEEQEILRERIEAFRKNPEAGIPLHELRRRVSERTKAKPKGLK